MKMHHTRKGRMEEKVGVPLWVDTIQRCRDKQGAVSMQKLHITQIFSKPDLEGGHVCVCLTP